MSTGIPLKSLPLF